MSALFLQVLGIFVLFNIAVSWIVRKVFGER